MSLQSNVDPQIKKQPTKTGSAVGLGFSTTVLQMRSLPNVSKQGLQPSKQEQNHQTSEHDVCARSLGELLASEPDKVGPVAQVLDVAVEGVVARDVEHKVVEAAVAVAAKDIHGLDEELARLANGEHLRDALGVALGRIGRRGGHPLHVGRQQNWLAVQ
eukprot:scaffold675264_cov76-Prasinocladus_malaysianus.AAC.1